MKPTGLWALCLFLVLPGELAAERMTTDVNATARLLAELIRVDTSNPPGDEAKVAELLALKFEPLGFEIDVIPTPQEGKAHFVARLRGDGSRKPVLLAAHADVVGVEREKWTFDPFAGTIDDGFVFGRGALDFKGGLAVFARAAMMLAENQIPLARDVIFLAEAGGDRGSHHRGRTGGISRPPAGTGPGVHESTSGDETFVRRDLALPSAREPGEEELSGSGGHAVALPGRHRCLRVEEPGRSRVRDLPLYPIDDEDLSRMHGNDERVSVESLGRGTELIYRTLLEVAAR